MKAVGPSRRRVTPSRRRSRRSDTSSRSSSPSGRRSKRPRGQPLAATSLANVRQAVDVLRASEPLLQARVEDGSLQAVGANYELESGAVVFDEAARGAK